MSNRRLGASSLGTLRGRPDGVSVVNRPATGNGVQPNTSSTAYTFGAWAELAAAALQTEELLLAGLAHGAPSASAQYLVRVGLGPAGSELVVATLATYVSTTFGSGSDLTFPAPIRIPPGTRIALSLASNLGSTNDLGPMRANLIRVAGLESA